MKRIGICFKCGKETLVRDHHWKGYSEEHKDDVVPYCYSCDNKAHNNARKEGRCNLTSNQSQVLSHRSKDRRSRRRIDISDDFLLPTVSLREMVNVNINTNIPSCATYFHFEKGNKVAVIYEEEA